MGTGLKLESSEYMNYQIDKNDDSIRSSHRTFFKLMINDSLWMVPSLD